MNKVVLIGNLTRDIELSKTASGKNYTKFSIAVKRNFAKEGETQADFINIVAWNNQAENCYKFLHKGDKIAVVGSIQTSTYEVEGQKRYSTDILASEIEFINTKKVESEHPSELKEASEEDMDDLPF